MDVDFFVGARYTLRVRRTKAAIRGSLPMPIYEYKCKKCGNTFEVQQSFGDEPVKTCTADNCGGRVQKLFSPPAIIFKGKGFHVTDYGRGSSGRSASQKPAPCSEGGTCETCPKAAEAAAGS